MFALPKVLRERGLPYITGGVEFILVYVSQQPHSNMVQMPIFPSIFPFSASMDKKQGTNDDQEMGKMAVSSACYFQDILNSFRWNPSLIWK